MRYPLAVAVIWIALGVVGAGFDNAYFQRRYSDICHGRQDLGNASIGVVFGPLNLLKFPLSGFGEYGWSLSPAANPKCKP
jgi:hypothetical protein